MAYDGPGLGTGLTFGVVPGPYQLAATGLGSLTTAYATGSSLLVAPRGSWVFLSFTATTGGAASIVGAWEASADLVNWQAVDAQTGGPAYTVAAAEWTRAFTTGDKLRLRCAVFGLYMRCKLKTDAGTATLTSAAYEVL